jgi:hypothetical protein
MDGMERNVNLGQYVSEYMHENLRVYAYFFIGFLVPFTLGHPQLLVGSVVNMVLILSALQFGFKKTLPLLFAPSLGILARGLVFGPFTPFLVVMLPFIWVANALLVLAVSKLNRERKNNYWITLSAGVGVKSGFLFSSAYTLVSLSILPPLFLATMGLDQVMTAIIGGIAAFGICKTGLMRSLRF